MASRKEPAPRPDPKTQIVYSDEDALEHLKETVTTKVFNKVAAIALAIVVAGVGFAWYMIGVRVGQEFESRENQVSELRDQLALLQGELQASVKNGIRGLRSKLYEGSRCRHGTSVRIHERSLLLQLF